jgi:hypothetical protein
LHSRYFPQLEDLTHDVEQQFDQCAGATLPGGDHAQRLKTRS